MISLVKACISRSALRHNAMLLRRLSQPARLCAIIKADAYGHGADLVGRALHGLADAWGVATIDEAMNLRGQGLREPILVFCPLDDYFCSAAQRRETLDAIIIKKLQPTVTSINGVRMLERRARKLNSRVSIQVKLDTGMGRSGCDPSELIPILRRAASSSSVRVAGVFSHFAASDEADLEFARRQLCEFKRQAGEMERAGLRPPLLHTANSAAIFNLPDARWDMVRPGIALYGYGGKYTRGSRKLRPVLDVYAQVVMTKHLPKGHVCGYGCTYIASHPIRAALVCIGYADGVDRRLSNNGQVDFDGRFAPIIGRVSMDTVIVDVTRLPDVQVGRRTRLISSRRTDPHSVEALADEFGTIPHEITCRLGARVVRCLVA